MADLVVGLAKSVVEGALVKVHSAMEEDANLRQRAQRDLVLIAFEFEMMHSFLDDANKYRAKNNLVATWVRHVRKVACDVEDCIELVVHLDDKPVFWRRLLPPCMAGPLPLDQAVAEIEDLKARVEDVSKCYRRYSRINDSASKVVMMQQPASSATALSMLSEARQHGLGDLAQLITKDTDDLQVISVWGAGSNHGSTSIIRKAYHDPEIWQDFTCHAWVKLMHPFNPDKFVRSFMAQLYANSCQEQGATIGVEVRRKMKATHDDLFKEFEQEVNKKRYLVVLENLTNMVDWDSIRTFLPDKKNGSSIIVSTQQPEVATLCIGHSYQLMELKQFSDEHSVCAFFKKGSHDKKGKNKQISTDYEMDYTGDPPFPFQGSSADLPSNVEVLTAKMKAARDWMEKSPLVALESQMNELRKYPANARLSSSHVISVWGMPGVGKSVLVKNLYYDTVLHSDQFNKFCWVDVPHPFSLRDFSQSLVLGFYSESIQAKDISYRAMMELKDPIHECQKILRNYRCLVVVNNLQSAEVWDLIRTCLVSPSLSVIIVTTIEASLATHCARNEELIFNVKGLEADAALYLFEKEVQRKNGLPPSRDHKGLQELIFRCGGLPQVIVAVRDWTMRIKSADAIKSMNQRFMNELETNPEFENLRGLFDWMNMYIGNSPDIVKPCILYMSIFPRRHRTRRRRLVRRWISEGYCKADYRSLEEFGEELFSKLVSMSIIQPPPQTVTTAFSDTRMVFCQVNAFLYEYIISRRKEENLVFQLGDSHSLTTQCTWQHLTICNEWKRDKDVFQSMKFSRLRSLTVIGNWESFFVSKSMKLLRVLDLEDAIGVKDDDLEKMVKRLCRLKFLSLRGCHEICRLPNSLGDLRQLQCLDIRHTSIITLPSSISKLQKLQYIRAGSTVHPKHPWMSHLSVPRLSEFWGHRQLGGVKVPRGIGKLTALHTFGVVNISSSRRKPVLEELGKLTHLRKLAISGINMKNSELFLSSVSRHINLESLSLQLEKGSQVCLDHGASLPVENLRSLKLYGLGDKLPVLGWNMLSKLVKLDFEMATLQQSDIEFIGKLPKLRILRVKLLQGVPLNFCVFTNGLQEHSYQKVKILEIACGTSLDVIFGSQTMINLELLKVDCSGDVSYTLSGLNHLSELKEVLLKGSSDETKTCLQEQLAAHPKNPVVKLEELPSSS